MYSTAKRCICRQRGEDTGIKEIESEYFDFEAFRQSERTASKFIPIKENFKLQPLFVT